MEKWLYSWISLIEGLVKRYKIVHNKDGTGEVLLGWIFQFVNYFLTYHHREIQKKNYENKQKADLILTLAYDMGLVLFAWACRTQLAKCFDSERPVNERQKAYGQFLRRCQTMLFVLDPLPTQLDKKIYNQKWEDPFDNS